MTVKKSLASRLEARLLTIWFILASALWGFFSLRNEVGEGDTSAFDKYFIALLRNPDNSGQPIGPAWLKDSMRDVTAVGGITLLTLLTIVAVSALFIHKKRRESIILAAVAISAQISVELLKYLYARPRPTVLVQQVHAYTKSFPSGHTTETTAIFLTLATVLASLETERRAKVLIFAASILAIIAVGFSRVYLGMHWPTDVVGGWVLGTVWAGGAWALLRKEP